MPAAVSKLPRIVIGHLGMIEAWLLVLLNLVRSGAKVKGQDAGFGAIW